MAQLHWEFNQTKPKKLIQVTRRTHSNLPHHIRGLIYWQDAIKEFTEGYYLPWPYNTLPLINYFKHHWHKLFEYRRLTLISLADHIKPGRKGTGYWLITDPQHPDYDPNYIPHLDLPEASTSAAPPLEIQTEELPGPLSEDPEVSPFIFARAAPKSSSSGKTDSQEGSTEFQKDSPEQDLQKDPVLVAQVQFRLDIQDREPENLLTLDQPAYLQLIEEAVEAEVNVSPPPPLASPQAQLAPQLPAPVPILPMAQQAQVQQQVAAPAALTMTDKLQGTISTIFNGNCRESENFLCQFNLFWVVLPWLS